jgi:hypothetical protein
MPDENISKLKEAVMQIPTNLNPYWLLLKDLNTAEKLSLVELLIKSIQAAPPAPKQKKSRPPAGDDDWVFRFAGSWSDFPESAEEMIALIEGTRTASRPIERL